MLAIFILVVEKTLQHYLQLDKESAKRMARLKGKVICIDLTDLDWQWSLHFSEQLRCSTEDVKGDVSIQGSSLAFFRTSQNNHLQDLSISGDMDVAEAFSALFRELNIDWQAHIASIAGDDAAIFLSQQYKKARKLIAQANIDIGESVQEYMQDEYTVSDYELSLFYENVDSLRADFDRLEAKFNFINISQLNTIAQVD